MSVTSVVDKIDKAVKSTNRGNTILPQVTHHGSLSELIHSVMRLAIFALEKGRLPEHVDLAEIYSLWYKKVEQNQQLNDNEVSCLGNFYKILETELAPVTAVSLRATDCNGVVDCMKSEAGKFARSQWFLTYVVFAVIVSIKLFQYVFEFLSPQWAVEWPAGLTTLTFVYQLCNDLVPFTYGTLGACAYVLRLTDQRIRDRIFDPRKIPEHRNRLVLGTLSGGIIVMFVSAGEASSGNIALTAAALGFLAGYSTDFLFAIIDRIIKAVSPSTDRDKDNTGVDKTEANSVRHNAKSGSGLARGLADTLRGH